VHGSNHNFAAKSVRGWWASPPRTGMRRIIAPWEYRHLRAFAHLRTVGGILAAGCSVLTLAFGGSNWKAYGWAIAFGVLAAANLAVAGWELSIARSEASQN
jgi:hypothetical protein